ncbi:RTA1 like protein-domain-containing protein [Dendryphion nanum]|uniref:RTA1 like protein-domain-containing protein n=1 Tax=Dendryphion nanum TaxID=256645 RepID=A0A9P9IAP0_9PLEO|nr:RTA1 like protein-domain-containing protein [Dendryphion nanum]
MAGGKNINDPNRYVMYRYQISVPAAAIFVALFGISSIFHIYQTWRKRSWFLIAFIIGGLFETIGYAGRIQSSFDQFNLSPYIMQTLLLLLGPALYAASIYMILGRLIVLTSGEKYSLVRPSWLTKIFVSGDVISFLMQGAGGGIMSTAKKNPANSKKGERIIVGGLFVQLIFFGLFVVTSALFQRRGAHHLKSLPKEITWKKQLYALYATSTLILVRSVFRVIEYLQGNAGYLLRQEVFLYVFDAVLMLGVMVIMNVVHPGDIAIMLKEKREGGAGSDVEMSTPVEVQQSKHSREESGTSSAV